MTIAETQQKILTDAQFVALEIQKITAYYQLKHTLRWGFDNNETDVQESVAEHIYGMQILSDYFLPLHENLQLKPEQVRRLILWHDMAEIITTDTTAQTKTEHHRNAEKKAEERILTETPNHLFEVLRSAFEQYEAQSTIEAKFVKALDKIEPMFHMYFVSQKPNTQPPNMNWPSDEYRAYRSKYLSDFPLLKSFDTILDKNIEQTGYFPQTA